MELSARGVPAAGDGPVRPRRPRIVLAMHCVPTRVDPAVTRFWIACAARLAERGYALVLLSTAELDAPDLNVIEISFTLTDFPQRLVHDPAKLIPPRPREVRNVAAWYRCPEPLARLSLAVAHGYFETLIETLRPVAVLGWQSVNPVTRALRAMAEAADVPFWACERGWVKGTLMFDKGQNNLLSEMQTSFALAPLRARGPASPSTVPALLERVRRSTDLARYAGVQRRSPEALRAELGIPAGATVYALFTHGEPFVNALEQSAMRELHGITAELLAQRVHALAAVLRRRGAWLLVQEHPFNRPQGREVPLPESPCVRRVDEHAHTLLDAADHYLYTLSTLQFEAAFLEKSFGLLSRSALYRDGEPPFIGDFDDAEAFIDAVSDAAAWPRRQAQLRRDIAFLYETLLLDLEPEALPRSAGRFVEHLSQFARH